MEGKFYIVKDRGHKKIHINWTFRKYFEKPLHFSLLRSRKFVDLQNFQLAKIIVYRWQIMVLKFQQYQTIRPLTIYAQFLPNWIDNSLLFNSVNA